MNFLTLIWSLLAVVSISAVTRHNTRRFARFLTDLLCQISRFVTSLIQGDSVNKISSGQLFEDHWVDFETSIFKDLNRINYIANIESELESYGGCFFGRKLVTQMTDLILGFSKKIELHLTSLTKAYVTKEINDIGESLNRESFFNLSSEPVSDDIKNNLKLGRKYIPFCKLAFKTELRKFDSEVLEILHRCAGFFPQLKNCASVSVLFRKLKKVRAIKSDPEKLI